MSDAGTGKWEAWIPFFAKLVWPVLIGLFLAFNFGTVREVLDVTVDRIKSGSEFEIAGLFSLGQAARDTQIGTITTANFNVQALEDLPGLEGSSGAIQKAGPEYLRQVRDEIAANPTLSIDTLLLLDGTTYSVKLLRDYISTLGLRYVLFTAANGEFEGWMYSNVFITQLPTVLYDVGTEDQLGYLDLKRGLIGIRGDSVTADTSARDVLAQMDSLHLTALPVLDANRRWKFFVDQGQILSRLMTSLLTEPGDAE